MKPLIYFYFVGAHSFHMCHGAIIVKTIRQRGILKKVLVATLFSLVLWSRYWLRDSFHFRRDGSSVYRVATSTPLSQPRAGNWFLPCRFYAWHLFSNPAQSRSHFAHRDYSRPWCQLACSRCPAEHARCVQIALTEPRWRRSTGRPDPGQLEYIFTHTDLKLKSDRGVRESRFTCYRGTQQYTVYIEWNLGRWAGDEWQSLGGSFRNQGLFSPYLITYRWAQTVFFWPLSRIERNCANFALEIASCRGEAHALTVWSYLHVWYIFDRTVRGSTTDDWRQSSKKQ